MKDPILITGAARSGTSIIAGVINLCGAYGGDLSGANRNNKKGMFENTEIRNKIVKPYLRSLGVDHMGQYPLPDPERMYVPADWRLKIEQVMRQQGCGEDQTWFYKGAKICLFWPVWKSAFPNSKYIIVRRKTPDIIRSCKRTGFMRAFTRPDIQQKVGVNNEHDGWKWWVHQHEKRFVEMMEAGLQTMQVWPERMIKDDYSQVKDMIEWLGLDWESNKQKVYDFVDEKLWKAKKK
jgi:hypothetical protein